MSNVTNRAQLSAAVREYYDRLNIKGLYKSLLIDLEVLQQDDREQAVFGRAA